MAAAESIVVFQLVNDDSSCSECNEELPRGSLLRKEGEKGLCMDCADLAHLEFLGAGDACITRRACKYSSLRVVVVRWSRARKRYERQGVLVQAEAIERAEQECLEDEDARARQRVRGAARRDALDAAYVASFGAAIRKRYPSAPADVETRIAEHACQRHSGRVGRTAWAKELDEDAIDLAVRAYIRHNHTRYDALLNDGIERGDARQAIGGDVDAIAERWRESR